MEVKILLYIISLKCLGKYYTYYKLCHFGLEKRLCIYVLHPYFLHAMDRNDTSN